MDENFKIGNFICELRKSKKLSQTDLGIKLNVTNKAVSRWETGRGLPDSSLLLPLAKELGVTVDEILRGEFVTSEPELTAEESPYTKISDKSTRIQKQNALLDYKGIKKQLLRDSLIVIPTLIFIVVWLYLGIKLNFDLAPTSDYKTSVIINLFVPLMIIGIAQIVYASFLITDSIRMQGKSWCLKLLICIGIYYAVIHLFFAVYLYRILRFFIIRKKMQKNL
ncbi:MAG: helix-turn-helix transcriptional regulator [Clostridia bacterium]|nr:helix-turn-helix transcriptional regulator [Clostridia bacterium]